MEESTKDLPAELGLNRVAQSIGNVGMRDGNTVNVGYFGSTQSSAPPGNSTLSGLFTLPRSATRQFVGRHELLTKLKDLLVHDGTPRKYGDEQTRIVITGVGGLGKSELCLKLAESVKHCFDHILWVDVDSLSSAQQGFISISNRLGLPAQTLEEAVQNLGRIKQTWLLVLDNADDLDMNFHPLFPRGSDGVVLMTSRNPECGQVYGDTHWEQLEGLYEQHAIDLLLKRARIKSDPHQCNKAGEIVHKLGCHTLAVTLAGSYVAHRKCTLESYLAVYESNWQRVMKHCPSQERSRYGQVMATFEASIGALEGDESDEAHDVIDLLNVLSVLDANKFGIETICKLAFWGIEGAATLDKLSATHIHRLTQRHVSMLPEFVRAHGADNEWDSDRLIDARNRLESMGLISTEKAFRPEHAQNITIHPLIHDWAWERQSQERKQASWIAAGSMLSLSHENCSEQFLMSFLRVLQQHASAFKGKTFELAVSQILFCCAKTFKFFDVHECAMSCINLIAVQELGKGTLDSLDHIDFGILWAETCWKTKDRGGYVQLMTQILDLEKDLPEDDERRIKHHLDLAGVYLRNGRPGQAVVLCEHVVNPSHRPENDPLRLRSRKLLANAYYRSDQESRGISCLQQVVITMKHDIRPEQTSSLANYRLYDAVSNLCTMYRGQTRYGFAIPLLEECVALSPVSSAERYLYCELLVEMFMKTDQQAKADEVWRDMSENERSRFVFYVGQDYESLKSKFAGSQD